MKRLLIAFVAGSCLATFVTFVAHTDFDAPLVTTSPWPDGRNFAFTITEDPDRHTLEKIKPVYDLLADLGFRTTVAVWVKDKPLTAEEKRGRRARSHGETTENADYLAYITSLQKQGFEIALHTVSGGDDTREETIEGYNTFRALFGHDANVNIMHAENLENIYWGKKVVNNSLGQRLLQLIDSKARLPFSGDVEGSEYFWGDVLRERTKYVRLWGTLDINTLEYNPSMPYHDPEKPYVNYWFSFSDGYNSRRFKLLLNDDNVEDLVRERGASIVYSHFAYGFTRRSSQGEYVLDEEIARQLKRLAAKDEGWFVPASVLLDRLIAVRKVKVAIDGNSAFIINTGDMVDGLTLLIDGNVRLTDAGGTPLPTNEDNEVVLGQLPAASVTTVHLDNVEPVSPLDRAERFRLFFERTRVYLLHLYYRLF